MIPFIPHLRMDNTQHDTLYTNIRRNTRCPAKCPEKSYIAAKDGRKRGKQGFRDTKAIFCLLGKFPNPHKTLPAASGCASVPDALTAVPAKEKNRCSMSITPTLHRTFHHRLLCLFSSSCRTSCSCSCSIFCSSSFKISCTIF